MEQRFCDGLEEVSVVSGVVRIDFFRFTAGPKDKNGRPPREHSHRVLLSPEAFIQTCGALDQVLKQLEQKGMVKRRPESAGAALPADDKKALARGGKTGG